MPYLSNYMNQMIIIPLARTRDFLTNGDFETALRAERGIIVSFPSDIKSEIEQVNYTSQDQLMM